MAFRSELGVGRAETAPSSDTTGCAWARLRPGADESVNAHHPRTVFGWMAEDHFALRQERRQPTGDCVHTNEHPEIGRCPRCFHRFPIERLVISLIAEPDQEVQ